jgi:hypothetical protein
MLMVVFGAGASYDSIPAYPPATYTQIDDRLPLANQLFENRQEFSAEMNNFTEMTPIIPLLQPSKDGITIERVLQNLQEEATEYPQRHKQLAAVRYYLHSMLWRCEDRWIGRAPGGATNQISLLDQIERWRKPDEQVYLVTFNYDRMLERALRTVGINIQSLSDYIASDTYKLIKLHGSVDWGREIGGPQELRGLEMRQLVRYLIDNSDSIRITPNYRLVDQVPLHVANEAMLFPAIAIPVETKVDYECPDEHLEALRAAIPEVDKLLLIGWRAAEKPFLEHLAENLRQPVKGLVVAGNANEALKTAARLMGGGVQGHFGTTNGGFTELVRERQADEFLSK